MYVFDGGFCPTLFAFPYLTDFPTSHPISTNIQMHLTAVPQAIYTIIRIKALHTMCFELVLNKHLTCSYVLNSINHLSLQLNF